MNIEYLYTEGNRDADVKVRLDGKIVGTIRHDGKGWQYFPKGLRSGGDRFSTLDACQKSLEASD